MVRERIRPLPPTIEIQLVYNGVDAEVVKPQQVCWSGDLSGAMAMARHALDLETYLAPLSAPPVAAPTAVQLADGPVVLWRLTSVQRTAEKRAD